MFPKESGISTETARLPNAPLYLTNLGGGAHQLHRQSFKASFSQDYLVLI
jgi:hypothetical protein